MQAFFVGTSLIQSPGKHRRSDVDTNGHDALLQVSPEIWCIAILLQPAAPNREDRAMRFSQCLLPRRQSGNLLRPGRVGLCRNPLSRVGVLDDVECCAPGVVVATVLLGVSGDRCVERGLNDRGPVGAHRLRYLQLVP